MDFDGWDLAALINENHKEVTSDDVKVERKYSAFYVIEIF